MGILYAAHAMRRWALDLWRVLPMWLMAGVAAAQIALALSAGLLAWKGGGFGMFATADRAATRALVVRRADAPGTGPVDVPAELADLERAALLLPTRGRLEAFGRALRQRGDAGLRPDEPLVLEAWRTRFDLAEGRLAAKPERMMRVRLD